MSSCVERGFDAQSASSAPPAFSARIRLAVSVVTCIQAAIRIPVNGFSFSKRSLICANTGILRSAHSMRFFPSAANDALAISCPTFVSTDTSAPLLNLMASRYGARLPEKS